MIMVMRGMGVMPDNPDDDDDAVGDDSGSGCNK